MIIFSTLIAVSLMAGSPAKISQDAKNETAKLQQILDSTGYLQLPPGKTDLTGLFVPQNATVVGSGGEIDCASGYSGPGLICNQPGFRILDVTMRGFNTGILVSADQPKDGTGESMIRGCRIYTYAGGYGINWQKLSDGYIDTCVLANLAPSGGVAQNPYYHSGAITVNTARAAIWLGEGAGGTTVSNCHTWGNNLFDIVDYAPDSILNNCRMEGGRDAHLMLASARIQVSGGQIWDPMHATIAAGIQLGATKADNPSGIGGEAMFCIIRGLYVGGQGEVMPGGAIRFVNEGRNDIEITVPGNTAINTSTKGHHPNDKIEIKQPSKG